MSLATDALLDMAEYTGAQERISLSKKGRTEGAKKLKAVIVELIDEA
jgi:Nineteen complex-related protein 2